MDPYFRKHGTGGITQPGHSRVNEATLIFSSGGSAPRISSQVLSLSPYSTPYPAEALTTPRTPMGLQMCFSLLCSNEERGVWELAGGVLRGGGCSAEGRRAISTIYNMQFSN